LKFSRHSIVHVRFSASAFRSGIFRLAILGLIATAVALAPFRLAAQEAATATASGTASAPAASSSDSGQSQEDQDKAFRLDGPIVVATAKALHLSRETTARMFELINFGIIVLAIVIPLVRFMPRFLRGRGEKVRADIESARKVTEDANARLSAVEAKLASLGDEIKKFKSEVDEDMKRDEVRIKAALEEESARIVASAEQEIGMAAAQARRGLRHFAADLAVNQAARQMVLTPETDRALIAEFVGDVTKGGQN
jgi:F-type H+-transporting ATPase subunit b